MKKIKNLALMISPDSKRIPPSRVVKIRGLNFILLVCFLFQLSSAVAGGLIPYSNGYTGNEPFKIISKNEVVSHLEKHRQLTNEFTQPTARLISKNSRLEYVSVDNIVKGKATNSKGEPLIGVSVTVKGSTVGTSTDSRGNYSIDAPAHGTLVFSAVGFATKEIQIKGRSSVNLEMEITVLSLDHVVVIGYGTQIKKLVTGATVEISTDAIQKRNSTSLLAAIQGQAPGVSITSTGGQPGSGFRVDIRGSGTVGSTTPLYIVDGVVTSDISYLNNADIASVDVLKDAASAAIYGARAANGVILITTKIGTSKTPQVSFDTYYGIQNISKKVRVLDGPDYIKMINEMDTNSGLPPNYPDNAVNEQILKNAGGGTDWMGLLLSNNVPMQNYNFGVEGATKSSAYALSLSRTQQGGIVGGTDLTNYKRTTFRINTEQKLYKDIFKVGENLSYSNIYNFGSNYPIASAIKTPPIIPNKDSANPSEYYYNNVPASGGDNILGLWSTEITNPYASMIYNSYGTSQTDRVVGDVYGDLKIINNLRFRSTLSFDYSNSENRNYQPLQPNLSAIVNANTSPTQVTQAFSKSLGITSDNIFTYSTTINGVNNFDAMVGMSAFMNNSENLSASNKNLLYNGFNYAWISNASGTASSGTMSMSGNNSQDALLSYFGRLNYNYKQTFLATIIFRSDGSSRFAEANRRGYFPSFSAGWNISNEPFMQSSTSWLNYLKLRGSWGQNGNLNIPPYRYLSLIEFNSPYSFGGDGSEDVGAALSNQGNPSLTWEKAQETDFGFDARFFKDQLGITFDWYNRETKDWLVLANTPSITGVGAPYINGGDVINKGVELLATYSKNISKDFSFTLSGNVAFNKNRVGSIPTADGILHGGGGTLYANSIETTRSQDGFPIGYFWGLETDGIFQTQQEVENYKNKDGTLIQPNAQSGDIRYVDRNGDGQISSLDNTMLGDGHPKATFGLTYSMAYKGFDLFIGTNGVAGNKILQNYIDANRNYWNITQDLYNDRWHGAGTSNKYPRLDAQMSNWVNFSDVFLYNGSYLKINNITIGYDFAKTVLKVKSLSQLRLYVSCQNVYNFTSYNGMDPEIGTGNNGVDDSEIGRDSGMYPHARTFLLGANFKF